MTKIFLHIVNMSISAGYVVLAVLLLRILFRRAPKWITVALWGIVALRLICPFSFESPVSLIPNNEIVSTNIMMEEKPTIDTGIPIIDDTINPVISENFAPAPGDSVNPMQVWITVFTWVWIIGTSAFILYAIISYIKIRSKVRTAILFQNNIYQSENIYSAFVLGIIKPRIYMPFNVDSSDFNYVLAHEKTHIRRKDHLIKPFGFILLAINWFNPLIWVSYVLLCRDIELACDEAVIKEFDCENRAGYSSALLTQSQSKKMVIACPLSFGEVGVSKRIKTVLNYKKPAFWVVIASILISLVVAVCFLTNPKRQHKNGDGFMCVRVEPSAIINIGSIDTHGEVLLTKEEQNRIEHLIKNISWDEDACECIYTYDLIFITKEIKVYYCVTCHQFIKENRKKACPLSSEDRQLFESILLRDYVTVYAKKENYILLSEEEFSYKTVANKYSRTKTPIEGNPGVVVINSEVNYKKYSIGFGHITDNGLSPFDGIVWSDVINGGESIVIYTGRDDIDKNEKYYYLLTLIDQQDEKHYYYFEINYIL